MVCCKPSLAPSCPHPNLKNDTKPQSSFASSTSTSQTICLPKTCLLPMSRLLQVASGWKSLLATVSFKCHVKLEVRYTKETNVCVLPSRLIENQTFSLKQIWIKEVLQKRVPSWICHAPIKIAQIDPFSPALPRRFCLTPSPSLPLG